MAVAIATNTPEPVVWERYTLRMLVERMQTLPAIMPLLNPLAVPPDKPLEGEAAANFLRTLKR